MQTYLFLLLLTFKQYHNVRRREQQPTYANLSKKGQCQRLISMIRADVIFSIPLYIFIYIFHNSQTLTSIMKFKMHGITDDAANNIIDLLACRSD